MIEFNVVETVREMLEGQKKIQQEVKEPTVKDTYTAEELLNMNIQEVPFLWKNLIPQSGLSCLTGSSDCNKSTLLRQLSIQIASKANTFLGFDLSPRYNKVIYMSTEDDHMSIAALLSKHYPNGLPADISRNIRFLFNTENHIEQLEKMLTEQRTDLIIIDTWTDLFGDGDINQSGKVRTNLKKYQNLIMKFGCAIIFIHHQGKASEGNAPSKNNLLGSQGIEAKVRTLIELRRDKDANNKRLMTITKGNYVSDRIKGKSFLLELDEERMLFQDSSTSLQLNLGNTKSKYSKEDIMREAIPLRKEGLSYEKILAKLKGKFGNDTPGLTTLKNLLNEQSDSQSPSK